MGLWGLGRVDERLGDGVVCEGVWGLDFGGGGRGRGFEVV